MKVHIIDLLILIVVGFGLVLADRYFRVERFTNHNSIQACGVNKLGLEPNQCSQDNACINGFCQSTNPPFLKPTMLPVFP